MGKLKVGDKAPYFNVPDQDGNDVSSNDFKGQKLILFFYPQDNTPGCTKEACSIRDGYKQLKKAGYQVLGISPDSSKKHTNFIKKFELQYPLLADKDKSMIEAYGVWGPKKFMGRSYIGLLRTTFLIDENGKIEHIIDKVKTKDHSDQILDLIHAKA